MKRMLLIALLVMTFINCCYAGQLVKNEAGSFYMQDDGTLVKSKWVIEDLDGDGNKESYYFNEIGVMLVNTVTPDGYQVNEKGQWVENGAVKIDENQNYIVAVGTQNTKKEDDFERVQNTEGIDPTMLPPKVVAAINKLRYWCNEDGAIIIPYSKKLMRYWLEEDGYKKDVINRALEESKIDWKEHAVIFAKAYSKKNNNKTVRNLLKIELFSSDDIEFAMKHINESLSKTYINPSDYIGLSEDEKLQKLISTGLPLEKAKEALVFLQSVNN